MILLDSNILLRYANPLDLMHARTESALNAFLAGGSTVCIVPQNLYEFWVVATRPANANGLALTTDQAAHHLASFQRAFTLLTDPPGLFREWESLVRTNKIQGKPSHDARIVAAMRLHGITQILTFNTADFTRFPGLTPIEPANVSSVP